MTQIADVVNVVVNVQDTKITQAGFGVPLIFSPIANTVFANRVRSYNTLTDVAVDFAATTKVYQLAKAIFSQERAPTKIKVGRFNTGDASLSTALDAIDAEDSDWYCLLTTYKVSADLQTIASWVNAKTKIALLSSEDVNVLDNTVTTDIASVLKNASYNRTSYMWHHQAGVDVVGAAYAVTSLVATITQVAHGLRIGDIITFSNSSGSSINGNNVVLTVPTANTFTVATTAANASAVTVDYFARYTFPESAWAGRQLSADPGSETWKFKELVGVVPVPRTVMTPTQEVNAIAKNANLYTTLGGVGHTHEGIMASGRYIDVQHSIDWMQARIGESVTSLLLNAAKIPYTDGGVTLIQSAISGVLEEAVNNGVLGPLLDGSGDNYRIALPKVADQTTINRTARYFPGITVQAQLAGAVHKLAITVNAQI